MECKKCGAYLEDDSLFCVSCGTKVNEEVEPAAPVIAAAEATPVVTSAPIVGDAKAKNSLGKTVGLAVGTILIIIGIIYVLSAGTSISSTSFGGDFYTYTYRGIVAISEQLASIQAALGWVVVAIGAAIDVRALLK